MHMLLLDLHKYFPALVATESTFVGDLSAFMVKACDIECVLI